MKKKSFLTLLMLFVTVTFALAQFVDSTTYDLRSGSIITAGQSPDGSLKLSGNYSHHGNQYGMNMKVDGQIKVAVDSNSTIRFLGSKYSKLNLMAKTSTDSLGVHSTQAVNDLLDTYDFVYAGAADTLTFTTIEGAGNDLYLPLIEVIPAQLGSYDTLTQAVKNIIYTYDFRNGSIIATDTDGKSDISKGLINVLVGSQNAYGYNGTQHGSVLKTGNQIILQVAGSSYIKVGGCQYSNGTISATSTSGLFDVISQDSKTTTCYHEDSASVNFLYVGSAGEVILDFEGTNYVPIIEVVPVPFAVELKPYLVKSGSIQVSSTVGSFKINYASGESATENPNISIDEGTVISATPDFASLRANLNGQALAELEIGWSGDIASVTTQNDSLIITFSGANSLPEGYIMAIADNSNDVVAEPGKTYSYDFANGSEMPQISYKTLRYNTFVTSDGIVTLNSNNDTASMQFGFHDSSHGAVFFPGNSMDIVVAGNATITFGTCQYGSATDGVFEITNEAGKVLGSISSNNIGEGAAGTSSFSYMGRKGVLTATLKSTEYATAEVYIHGLTIENAAAIISNGKTDVWDFGAAAFDTVEFNNNLSVDVINSWYAESITPGTAGNVLPSFSASVLSWIGGGNDRLRTTNTELTRYDENIGGAADYAGRVYVNSSSNPGRYMSLTLSEDDEVTIVAKTDAGGNLNFEYVADPAEQTDQVEVSSEVSTLNFVAKNAGNYHIYDNKGKPSYYRIYRKDADYVTITGTVDTTKAANIASDYAIVYKNEAGKTWNSTAIDGDT